ncbi:MAG: RnfABCDGE type electron transport complex subunit G [Azoarcus sp.]|jgi:electron transport complex protein RnfG|nr:RnfABCDGE type electron transport complex subunit G [Azoarcus sp.]
MEFEKIKAHPLYQPLLLGGIALLVSATLAWAASAAKEPVEAAEARDLRNSLEQVLPEGFADNDLVADSGNIDIGAERPLQVYRARLGKALKGLVFKVIGKGYGGEIVILMAVDKDGSILGVRVLKHTETPGLGDKIDIAKNGWVNSFDGKALDATNSANWAVKKDGGDFDQFAGATITPRAVVKAVKGGLETFARHKAALLGERE